MCFYVSFLYFLFFSVVLCVLQLALVLFLVYSRLLLLKCRRLLLQLMDTEGGDIDMDMDRYREIEKCIHAGTSILTGNIVFL